jgi:butyryl-CoA dehydrogenase
MEAAVGELTSEQLDLREVAARIAADRYLSKAQEWDRDRTTFPHEEKQRLGELGLLGIAVPEEYGGGGRPLLDALVVIEELAKATPLSAWPTFEASAGPARVVHLFGTEEQRERLLPPVCRGEKTIAVSISEADAGSAATDAQTKARIEGDEIVVNGTKRWCSGAGHAEQYLVYVRLGPEKGASGIGAVIVDKEADGLEFGPRSS